MQKYAEICRNMQKYAEICRNMEYGTLYQKIILPLLKKLCNTFEFEKYFRIQITRQIQCFEDRHLKVSDGFKSAVFLLKAQKILQLEM